jgi:hypothetical protein
MTLGDEQIVCVGSEGPGRNAVYLSTDRGVSWRMLGGKPIDEFYPDGGYGDLEYDPTTGWFVYLSYRGKGLHESAEIVQYRFRMQKQKPNRLGQRR